MSLVINDSEVISNFYVDSNDRKFGTTFSFIVPNNSTFINFNRIKRFALAQINMSYLPYNVYDGNNSITISDGTNTYTATIPYGYYDFFLTTSPRYWITALQTALNSNPFGWVFVVSQNLIKSAVQWTCSVPVRVVSSTMLQIGGILNTTVLSLSYQGAINSGVDSNIFYITSKALTKNSIRDAHTNSVINNVVGIVSQGDGFLNSTLSHVEKSFVQLKIFDWELSEPIGSEIDIEMVDQDGRSIIPYPEYRSSRMTLEFKIVSTRNPTFETFIKQY